MNHTSFLCNSPELNDEKKNLTPNTDVGRFELTRNIEYTPVTHKTSL